MSSPKEETLELLKEYVSSRDLETRNRIVVLNLGLVGKIAKKMSHQEKNNYEDIFQVGTIGLIKAIERFDPIKNCSLASLAIVWIRGEILHHLANLENTVRIPHSWIDLSRKAKRFETEYYSLFQEKPSRAKIADHLGVKVDRWSAMELVELDLKIATLDKHKLESENSMTGVNLVIDSRSTRDIGEENKERLIELINQSFSLLDEKTKKIFKMVYFNGLTKSSAAARLNCDPVTVTRREKKGFKIMKNYIRESL